MAQNSYLTNLLGIDPSGVEQTRYEYTLPIFNELLSKGLSEDQITGYDEDFGIFKKFPYKSIANPQQNYAQYEVVPQVDVSDEDEQEEEEETEIDYSNVQSGKKDSNSFDTISTQKYGTIRDNVPETLNISGVPLNDMTEQELMEYGIRKGYIDKDTDELLGPMQVEGMEKIGLAGNILSKPAQMMNDKQYEWFTNALKKKKMFLSGFGGEGEDRKQFATFSKIFQEANKLSQMLNKGLNITGSSGTVKIPGTFKKVNAIMNQFAPSGQGEDNVVYHTGSGGHYLENGKFQSAYGVVQAHGSMSDAIDTLKAAAESGNSSAVPDKFDKEWVEKQQNNVNLSKTEKETIQNSWDQIQDNNSSQNIDKTKTYKKGSCFHPEQIIGNKLIKDLEPGDLINGIKILGMVKLKLDEEMYSLHNVKVTGTHKVKYNNNWIYVSKHPDSFIIDDKPEFVYVPIVKGGTFIINDNEFADYDDEHIETLNNKLKAA
jgi:hypothetical protein